MKQCLYASRALCTFSPALLDGLLAQARANNHALGLTGLLVYGHGGFVQVVEGPSAAVDALFARIADDPRHEILMQTTRPIEARHFPAWQMAYARFDAPAQGSPSGFVDVLDPGFDLSTLPGLDPLARSLIEALRTAGHAHGGVPERAAALSP